ncbi:MAG: transcriptional regulator [Amycolatopsis sp.]|uniref:winged helix-turn-helix transcriptional regulator n=1 Tax=Amycolatopsis sp. TaxID=37632 RepID=UPI002634D0A8|nr:winged helix-turn-helix transcriptional regulator [Amycolatopsis sp.]MCU1680215.1 transcriptional regulator [Amycolatopsis sp.]
MKVGAERFLRRLYDLKYLVGDKWTLAILVTLSDGPMRRVEILSTINSYSIGEEWSDKHAILHDSMLARTLKKMTEEGLLARERDMETFPPKVFYSLNQEALEFLELADPFIDWAEAHTELIAQAQAYSRRRGRDVGTLTGIEELDSGGIDDDEDDGD